LLGKNESNRNTGNRIDTLIGAGVRIEGSIAFTGVLRTEGEIVGNVASADGGSGTVVVGKSGRIEGSVRAGHVIVGGQVRGDLHAADSAEVQASARVAGDIEYRRIVVHAGGVIDGALAASAAVPMGGQESAMPTTAGAKLPTAMQSALPAAKLPLAGKPGSTWPKFAVAAVVVGVVVMIELSGRKPAAPALQVAEDAAATDRPAAARSEPAPVPIAMPAAVPAVSAEPPVVAAVPTRAAEVNSPEPPPAARPAAATDQVVIVRGDHPGKSVDFVFVSCKDGCVLTRKKADATGEGSRIEVARGAKKRVAISADEQLRVVEGEDVEIFYQGRKVSPGTIRSGAWMHFVPYVAAIGR